LQIPRPDHREWWLRQSSKMAIEKSFYPSELTARRYHAGSAHIMIQSR